MPRQVEFPELPECNVCQHLHLPHPQPATGDSVVRLEGERDRWGYTCDTHAFLRIGTVTPLVKVER
jgi:hypothetical protein